MRHSGGVTHTIGSVEVESLDLFDRLRRRSTSMAGWFVGQVMKATGGKANPQAVSDVLKTRLGL